MYHGAHDTHTRARAPNITAAFSPGQQRGFFRFVLRCSANAKVLVRMFATELATRLLQSDWFAPAWGEVATHFQALRTQGQGQGESRSNGEAGGEDAAAEGEDNESAGRGGDGSFEAPAAAPPKQLFQCHEHAQVRSLIHSCTGVCEREIKGEGGGYACGCVQSN